MSIEEILESVIQEIPEEFQPLMEAHLPILQNMIKEEVLAWLDLIIQGDYEKAYQATNLKMSPSERVKEQERLNTLYQTYNQDTINKKNVLEEFFRQLLQIAILLLRQNL